jgi:hypothetical protein
LSDKILTLYFQKALIQANIRNIVAIREFIHSYRTIWTTIGTSSKRGYKVIQTSAEEFQYGYTVELWRQLAPKITELHIYNIYIRYKYIGILNPGQGHTKLQ